MRVVPSVVLLVLLAVTGAPTVASAVTVDQIVALSKAGISEPIILALIERDKTVFTIDPEQLIALQRDGISENVIIAMLKSGREEGEAAANAAAAFTAAAIMSSLSTAPEVVIVGHGPDRPNGGYSNGYWSGPIGPDVFAPPIFYDAPFYGTPSYGSKRFQRRPLTRPFPPASLTPVPSSPSVCIAQGLTSVAPPQVGSRGFVTVCPPSIR
jgi:hypothetical protein